MNTVASLPAKLKALADEVAALPAMSLTGSSVILPVPKAAEIVVTMRRAAAALATPAVEGGLPPDDGETLRLLDARNDALCRDAANLIRRLATPEQPGSAVQGEDLFRDDWISPAELEKRLDVLAEEYEWGGDELVTITERERMLLIDFAHGIMADDIFVAMMKAHHDPNAKDRPTTPPPAPAAEQGLNLPDTFEQFVAEQQSAPSLPLEQMMDDFRPEARGVEGSCDDPRLKGAGYYVCGSNADREWHFRRPNGEWQDRFRSEEAAVDAALREIAATPNPVRAEQPEGEGAERWITQTTFYDPAEPDACTGNCTEAAVASILGIPLNDVPCLAGMKATEFWDAVEEFFASRGFVMLMQSGNYVPECLYLAGGQSPRGCSHMVVMRNGKLVHDPHPSRAGIDPVEHVWLIVPLDPSAHPAPAAPVGVEWPLSLLERDHWREVYVGHRCMRLEVTYAHGTWERLMAHVDAALAGKEGAK